MMRQGDEEGGSEGKERRKRKEGAGAGAGPLRGVMMGTQREEVRAIPMKKVRKDRRMFDRIAGGKKDPGPFVRKE